MTEVSSRQVQDPQVLLATHLSRDRVSLERWEREVFDEAAAPFEKRLVLYGAGGVGRMTLRSLRRLGIEPLAFSDRNEALWGSQLEGLFVLSPKEAAARYGREAAFVVTVWNWSHRFADTRAELSSLGCEKVVNCAALFYKYPAEFLPYYALDSPHNLLDHSAMIGKAFEVLSDSESRNEFLTELNWRMTLVYDHVRPIRIEEQYFPKDLFSLGQEAVFVDCGAYDGDTLRQFLAITRSRFEHAVAFEPDPKNYSRLVEFVSSLPDPIRERIGCREVAVGRSDTSIKFDARGEESSGANADGTTEIQCRRLDAALEGLHPTYIKMDIEGAEEDALTGAAATIRASKPILAICVYHRPDHFWKIPLIIHSLSPGYRIYFRRYCEIPWELVCYAVPSGVAKT